MKKLITTLLWIAATLSLIAVVLRLSILNVWTVPDDIALDASIRPTLAAGDVLITFRGTDPGFSNLVRCIDPEDAQRWVVGRIVGLEGDTVEVGARDVSVNGRRFSEAMGCDATTITVPHPRSGAEIPASCDRVEFGPRWHYRAFVPTGPNHPQTFPPVQPGHVLLLSDNRSFHDDSRDFGPIPLASCVDSIVFRLWGKEGFFASSGRRLMGIR